MKYILIEKKKSVLDAPLSKIPGIIKQKGAKSFNSFSFLLVD